MSHHCRASQLFQTDGADDQLVKGMSGRSWSLTDGGLRWMWIRRLSVQRGRPHELPDAFDRFHAVLHRFTGRDDRKRETKISETLPRYTQQSRGTITV